MAPKTFTISDVEKHTSEKDAWLIIEDKVYNVTDYLNEHPGGSEILMDVAGQDASDMFESIGHSNDARKHLEKLLVGDLYVSEEEKEAKRLAKEKAIKSRGGLDMTTVLVVAIAIALAVIYSNPEYKAKVMAMLGQ